MTYCPKCGTANREGSRFCNQCGELLGTEEQVKCAECGTLNPGQNLLCAECGARLAPSSDSEPNPGEPSLPTRADAETDDESPLPPAEPKEAMPAWLRELGATLTPEDRPESDAPEESTDMPAWLRDLRASMPTESIAGVEQAGEADKATEPLAEPPPSSEGRKAPPPRPEMEEAEDWPTDSEEPTAPSREDEAEPDWLAELRFAARDREPAETPMALDADEEETPDWLAGLGPTEGDIQREKARPAQEAAPSTDDKPESDWLDMGPPSEVEDREPELPAFDAEDDESLDWMAELIPPPDEADAGARKATPKPDEEQAFDWLAEVDDSPKEARKQAETLSEAGSADEPDWLTEGQASDVEGLPEREAPISESEQIPDWLAASQISIPEAEPEAEPELEEALPTWDAAEAERADMSDTQPVSASGIEVEFPEPTDKEDREEFPGQDFPFPATSIEGEEESELTDKAEEDAELSEWLAELRPPISELEPEATEPTMADEGEEGADQLAELAESTETAPITMEEEPLEAEFPEWLADLQVEETEEATAEFEVSAVDMETAEAFMPSAFDEEEDGLERADIPAWLMALKPAELREEGEPAEPLPSMEGIDTDTGLLSGFQGTLPIEMIIAQPRAVTAPRAVEAAITETEHTRLFGSIVGRAQEAAPRQIVRAPTWQPKMLPRWILYLALIVVVSLPLFLPEPLVIRTIEPAPAMTDLYNVIEALDSAAAVLVAFDYDPTTSGEMDVVGQALVGHLMDKGTRVIAMSLLPAGPATAQPLLDGLAAERPDYADSYGQRYVNLGYLPGQAMAVRLVGRSPARAFAIDFQGTPLAELPVMDGLTSAEDFDLILELAAGQESVRWWIEQASMPYGVPLGAGVSAPVAPLAQPYYETDPRQLVGLIGGTPGAVTYEALQSSQGSSAQPAVARLDSQMAGQLLLVLVLLVGNGIFLVQRGARR